uniref:Uncharacterized protein n=1 Tax=Rhodosorus marinus TaxID=101924 RepID=A0A7S0BNC0_9RHOD|mmetsp:Transcript_23888/g.34352  ORF Transcript_23888/g.34352 Transcript_23888/m.34352 type:complete len:139 (+) Transcript_23888:140-556(+)
MATDDDINRRLVLHRRRQDLLVWENFSEEEKEACRVGAREAALGGLAGAGATTTVLALGRAVIRKDIKFPRYIRWLVVPGLVACGGYFGAMSTIPKSMRRIMALDDSELAEIVQIEVENWNLGGVQSLSELKRNKAKE